MDKETVEPKEDYAESLSGFPEGTVLPSGEKIVVSRDEDGVPTGWHKEPK